MDEQQQQSAPQPAPVVDVSGALASEGLQLAGHDEATGLPLVKTPTGQIGTFNAREYAKVKYGQEVPANVQFQYNSADNPVQVSPESLGSRVMLENFYDDKTKLAKLTSKYGEVIPDRKNGLVVNNHGVYQAYDPKFWNTYNPQELAEGFVEQVPKMVGATLAGGAVAALAGNPLGLAAIAGTGLAAGLASGAVRTSLGRFLGTYNATQDEQIQDVGLEGLINLGGAFVPPGAKGLAGLLIKSSKAIANGASAATKSVVSNVFGSLTKAGEAATEHLIERSPAVVSSIAKNVEEAGDSGIKEAVNVGMRNAANYGRSWLEQGAKMLPKKFAESLETASADADQKGFTSNVSDVIKFAKAKIEDLNLGKFEDSVSENTGKILTKFRALNEAEKTDLGVAGLTDEAHSQVQRVADLISRYQNDGELTGAQAFKRLANLNKELNNIKYGIPANSAPELERAVSVATGAVKDKIGQEMADQGIGDAWIAANKLYQKYADAMAHARQIADSPDGIYRLMGKITGHGEQRSMGEVVNAIRELQGDAGELVYNKMMDHYTAAKFTRWAPQLGFGTKIIGANAGTAAVATGHGTAAAMLAAPAVAGSSPRLVAKGINGVTGIGRAASDVAEGVLPYVEKFQDYLRSIPPGDRHLVLQNPAYVTGAYQTMQQAIQSIPHQTKALMQGAQQQVQKVQQSGQSGQ